MFTKEGITLSKTRIGLGLKHLAACIDEGKYQQSLWVIIGEDSWKSAFSYGISTIDGHLLSESPTWRMELVDGLRVLSLSMIDRYLRDQALGKFADPTVMEDALIVLLGVLRAAVEMSDESMVLTNAGQSHSRRVTSILRELATSLERHTGDAQLTIDGNARKLRHALHDQKFMECATRSKS